MTRILLVLNRTNREMPVMAAIAGQISVLDPQTNVKIIPFDGNFMSSVAAFAPDVVLMFPMGSIGIARMVYLIKARFGCRVVCIRAEGILDRNSPQSVANHVGFDTYGPRLIDAELFWGPGPAELIGAELLRQNKLSSPDRVRCFGYPRLERYFIESAGANTIPPAVVEKLRRYPKSKIVLAITGFHFANYNRKELFDAGDLEAERRWEELLDLVEKVKRFRHLWAEGVLESAARHPDFLFIAKRHPNERFADYASLTGHPNILYIGDEIALADILERAGLLVHYGSTAAADAYIAGVPTVYVYSELPELQEWFPQMGWPASRSASVLDFAATIDTYASSNLEEVDQNAVDAVLEWNFNIRRGVAYTPSKDIAQFLLSDKSAQRVPLWDKCLWLSLIWYSGVKVRQWWAVLFAGKARAASPS